MASKDTKKVDLEEVIKLWAKDYLERNGSRKEKSLLKKELAVMDIDWKRVKFDQDPVVYNPHPPAPGSGIPTNHVLFNTTFTNRSPHEQSFSFRTERTTRSSCTLEVEQGCATGVEMNVKLSTPCEILEVNAGFKREITLVNTDCQTVEEELTWGVDSQVKVEPGHTADAKLVILEEEYKGAFEVKSRISGVVRVVLRNLKDNNSFMKAIERPVVDIVKEAILENSVKPSEAFSVDDATREIVSTMKGKCHFRYGIKQTIEVDQKPIV